MPTSRRTKPKLTLINGRNYALAMVSDDLLADLFDELNARHRTLAFEARALNKENRRRIKRRKKLDKCGLCSVTL